MHSIASVYPKEVEGISYACIGQTSAKACKKVGLPEDQIFFPDKPGIDGWTTIAIEALNVDRPLKLETDIILQNMPDDEP